MGRLEACGDMRRDADAHTDTDSNADTHTHTHAHTDACLFGLDRRQDLQRWRHCQLPR